MQKTKQREGYKRGLTIAPVQAYLDLVKMLILETDAGGVGIRSMLSQDQDGMERVIA